jgi:IS5 family transposase
LRRHIRLGSPTAILLTGGEARDCPLAERLIRRVKPPKHMLGDKAYDSAELCEELDERGTKPVIPNRSNRKHPSASTNDSTNGAGASRAPSAD